jgi:hypothetical protein
MGTSLPGSPERTRKKVLVGGDVSGTAPGRSFTPRLGSNPQWGERLKTYLIGYDLNRPGQNYPELFDAIKQVGGTWWHCLDSTWIVKSDSTAKAIRDELAPHVDQGDELLVVNLTGESAWRGFNKECSDWLLNNIEPN